MCQTQDILLTSVPVRLVFPIPQKNNIFLRQESLKLLYDGISSQPASITPIGAFASGIPSPFLIYMSLPPSGTVFD